MMNPLEMDASRMLRHYRADQGHAMRVRSYALQILSWVLASAGDDAAGQEAGQDMTSRLQLRLSLASLLHDVGHLINNKNHHRHTRYIITHDDRTALWDRSMRDEVAVIAFAHRKRAKSSWSEDLFHGDIHLMQLAAILRIADGLDRRHSPGVEILGYKVEDKMFTLRVQGLRLPDAAHVEERKADLWTEVFPHGFTLNISTLP